MSPIGPRIIRVTVRSIVVTAGVIGRPIKDRHRERYRQSDENSGLRLRLTQQRDADDNCEQKKDFFHIVAKCRRRLGLLGYDSEVAGVAGVQELQNLQACIANHFTIRGS